jgi:hypothetical protein
VVLASCGGSDPVKGYVDDVTSVMQEMTRRSIEELPPGTEPTRSQVTSIVEFRRSAVNELKEISPPDEFAVEHPALIAALDNLTTRSESFLEQTDGLDPDQFLAALELSTDIDDLAATVATVCRVWESRSAELGLGRDLGC